MRLLELHCDYIHVKPKQKALKTIADLPEEDKNGLRMENVLVVFSTFEEGDDALVVERAAAEVQKNFNEVKASAVLVYPYAHLSATLAKPSLAQALLDDFLAKVKTFAPQSKKSPFGFYKEFELKCKGHPLAELSKTIRPETLAQLPTAARGHSIARHVESGAELANKAAALGAKELHLTPTGPMFSDYGKATAKTAAQNETLEAQRNTALLLTVYAAEELLGATPTVAYGKDEDAYVDLLAKPLHPETLRTLEKQAQVLVGKALPVSVKKVKKSHSAFANALQKEAAEEVDGEDLVNVTLAGKTYWLPGPFCKNTKDVQAFVLTKFGGSYWRNHAKNTALQRVHVVAFASQKKREEYQTLQAEAEKRDHRVLGKQLDLFSTHEEGAGFIFYHPNGMILFKELEKFIREQYEKRGYSEIRTPILLNEDLWHQSGHWDHYKENMYFTQIDGVPHAIKPMNCPGAILVYKTRARSYRELPLRLAENGIDHRHELSGVLSGMFRVRGFTQDDAHVFVTEEQIQDEVAAFIDFLDFVYTTFGFEYEVRLSTKPEKAMGSDEFWQKAESALKKALAEKKRKFEIGEGDGAFYGPKIDFKIHDALGRPWQCGTIQLDLQMPEKFDLYYEGSDGKRHRPVILHRVIYGAFERFLGVLIEHFAGAFPAWLSPVQAIVLPLTDNENDYAEAVRAALKDAGVRAKADLRSGKLEGKIREAQLQKIPYMLVVGQKEKTAETISVRTRNGKVKHGVKTDAFLKDLLKEIRQRKLSD